MEESKKCLMTTKESLILRLKTELKQRIDEAIADSNKLKESRDNETKSSAGDKYETGRAMVAIEMEKLSKQIYQLTDNLQKLDVSLEPSKQAKNGSLVITDKGTFFLCIGLGKVKMEALEYFAISGGSPIGKEILGKSPGESFQFNGRKYLISEIQ